MYRLRWYCCAILNRGRFGDLRTIYQGCRALPFALAGLSCYISVWILSLQHSEIHYESTWHKCFARQCGKIWSEVPDFTAAYSAVHENEEEIPRLSRTFFKVQDSSFICGVKKDQIQLKNTYTSSSSRWQYVISLHIHSSSGSEARRRRAIFTSLSGPVTYHLAVDGTTHAIMQLRVQLWQCVSCTSKNKQTKWLLM